MFRQIIPVRTIPPYSVQIGAGLLTQCGAILADILKTRRVAVVTDTNVAPLYLGTVVDSLESAGFHAAVHVLPAGEQHKNIETLSEILEFLAESRLTRVDAVLALGGGVTGDMVGFAAGCYLRGVRFVQLPTTLLAAVDSSVGGKTAIDLKAGKNLAGLFLQPTAVLCDTDALNTLSPALLADGAAEVVKTGVLCGENLFARLEDGTWVNDLAEIIAECVRYKAGIVERDERESGERRLLNLGHTVGHAVEKCSGYAVSHGHAVAIGLAVIARASDALGWTRNPIAKRIEAALVQNNLPISTEIKAEELASAALADKKRVGDTVTLIVPEAIGKCVQKAVPVTELAHIIRAGTGV